MTDPAIEAAQRAWDTTAELTADGQYVLNPYWIAKSAAREALKPIRELYSELNSPLPDGFELPGGVKHVLQLLAPLIFTTEELER